MREITHLIDSPFEEGLRRFEKSKRNSGFMTECFNAVPRKRGMQLYEAINQPFSAGTLAGASITIAHPFPQLFRGKIRTLLMDETAIFAVDESTWGLTALTTYDVDDPTSGKAITGSGVWHFTDLGTVFLMNNGTSTVFKTNVGAFSNEANAILVDNSRTVQTGCHFRGRTIIGGFDATDFWTDDWFDYWGRIENKVERNFPTPEMLLETAGETIGTNFVWWGAIGGGDVFMLFYPVSAIEGHSGRGRGFNFDRSYFMDAILRNDIGFMPMPWQGSVLQVKPLGKNVVVYGEGGVSALYMHEQTFGLHEINKIGVAGRGAVCGNDKYHVFMDNAGDLWYMDEKLQPQILGYKEFLSSMIGNEITMSFDEREGDVFIGDGTDGYMLTKDGLTETRGMVTSLEYAGSEGLVGIEETKAGGTDDQFRVFTDIHDFGYRAIKHIGHLEIGIDVADPTYLAVDYRYNKEDAFSRTAWVPVNNEGVAYISIAGVEFRFGLKVDPTDEVSYYVNPDYLKVHLRDVDKRFQRSPRGVS